MDQSKLVADTIDNLRRVFQVIHEYSKKVEHTTGLTSPQLWAIKALAEAAPVMVSELARRMYLHPATVVGILTRLEVSWSDRKDPVRGRPPNCLGRIDPQRKRPGRGRSGSGPRFTGSGVGKNTAKRPKRN